MFCSLYERQTHQEFFQRLKSEYLHTIGDSISSQGRKLMKQNYLAPKETVEERLLHACVAFSDSFDLACRLADYISKGWFMFASPLLANAGTDKGLPVSCFLSYVPDSIEGLTEHAKENAFLSSNGGGCAGHWSDVRSIGTKTSTGKTTTGIIPFLKVLDAQTLAYQQSDFRGGAYAAYLNVSHPEILEFLEIRSTEGDVNRKSFNIHHGVNIPDAFMEAVLAKADWDLIDPHTKEVKQTVKALDIWKGILQKRLEDRGEPYVVFIDAANRSSSYAKDLEERIKGSNLCLAPGTLVMTKEGHFPIEQLVGRSVEVWDGNSWVRVDNFRVTANDVEVFEVELYSGQTITATANHKFVLEDNSEKSLDELSEGDCLLSHNVSPYEANHYEKGAYLKGFLLGDGTSYFGKPMLHLYEPKDACIDKLIESCKEIKVEENLYHSAITEPGFTEKSHGIRNMQGLTARKIELLPWVTNFRKQLPSGILNWNTKSKLEFISGYLDADGTLTKSNNYQITSIEKESLKMFQLILHSVGVVSKLTTVHKGGLRDFGEDRGGEYNTKPLYRISMKKESSIKLSEKCNFQRLKNATTTGSIYQLKNNSYKVKSIKSAGVTKEVYCCTVDSTHRFVLTNGVISGNCTEIFLITSEDKTAVCDLSSTNVATFNEWYDDRSFINDLIRMLDNSLDVFIEQAPSQIWRAVNSAKWERSVGLGIMGMSTYKQQENLAFDSPEDAYVFNYIREQAITASEALGKERGVPEAAKHLGRRNTHVMAVAPNASSSIMLGVSPGIEPYRTNCYTIKQGKLIFELKSQPLSDFIDQVFAGGQKITGFNSKEEVWQSIRDHNGSIQHLDFFYDVEKEVYKTAFELDQLTLIKTQAERESKKDGLQGTSLNLFFEPTVSAKDFHQVHLEAWRRGLKSLYYVRLPSTNKMESTATQAVREEASPSIEEESICIPCQG